MNTFRETITWLRFILEIHCSTPSTYATSKPPDGELLVSASRSLCRILGVVDEGSSSRRCASMTDLDPIRLIHRWASLAISVQHAGSRWSFDFTGSRSDVRKSPGYHDQSSFGLWAKA